MQRIRIQVKRRTMRRQEIDVIPLDPRDPDVVRAKRLARLDGHDNRSSTDATARAA